MSANTLLNDVKPRLQTTSIYENEYRYLTTKRDDLSVIIGTMNASKMLPNSQLTDTHSDGAKIAYAAKVNNEQGRAKAQEYLDANNLNKTIVDTSRYHVMVKDRTTGEYTLGGRGMNPLDGQDILNVSQQILGVNESRRIAGEMIEKVGGKVELRMFSMSGADGFDLALDYNVDAILYDPPINLRQILKNSLATGERTSEITVVRNAENVISSGTMFRNVSMYPQYEVDVVPVGSSGLIESHKLVPNFTKNQVEDFHQSAVELQRRGTVKAQADTLVDMKKAINARRSFTDFLEDLSPVDVNGGRLGVRVNRDSALVRMWEQVGGAFTEGETEHLRTAKTSGDPANIIVGDDILNLINANRFEEAEGLAQDIFDTGVSAMENTDVARNPSVLETLAEQAHPTALGVGLFGAILGGELSNLIDPSGSFSRDDRLGVDLHQAMSGGLGAGFTELGMAGMGGTALGAEALPVLAGGALGAVAGTETQVGVYNVLDRLGANSDTKQSLSDISGGAVGGAVFSATSIAGAVAMGAEIGSAGGAVGIAVGAGVGALFGAGAYLYDKLSHHEKKKERTPNYTPPKPVVNNNLVTQ
jgi:hypothetical protein